MYKDLSYLIVLSSLCHLGGFATARLADHNEDLVVVDGLDQLVLK